MKITSSANERIKSVAKLRSRAARGEYHLTIAEGVREITCALESGVIFKECFVCPEILSKRKDEVILKSIYERRIPVIETTQNVFEKVAFGDRKEGILAVCHIPNITLKELSCLKEALFVVIEKVEKPGNLGAILRTCDGAGVDGVIICDQTTDIFNPNCIRSSLGTVFSLPLRQWTQEDTLQYLRNNHAKIIATSPQGSRVYTQVAMEGPVSIVIGSEQKGLSDFWMRHSDIKVRIPMRGKANSLNVSATAAVMIYEAIRQKRAVSC